MDKQKHIRVISIVFKQEICAFTEIFVFADFFNMVFPHINQVLYVSEDSAHQTYLGENNKRTEVTVALTIVADDKVIPRNRFKIRADHPVYVFDP